jgi:transcriptional regulator with GAF, ATPase, and Fis domain
VTDLPVLIEGETGTGKEVLAESLHLAGPRSTAPFIVFDCTAIAPNLIETALFGQERGAYTGAVSARKGAFEQAHGGTLFVDEIGDLDLTLQPKLLRALERSEVQRVGGDRWIKVDVRVLSATRRDLDREIQAGRFRDDLFFRLAVGRVELPPLRKRAGDVRLLAEHFWKEQGGAPPIPPDFLQQLEDHSWPGNVRELRNAIARRVALGNLLEAFRAVPDQARRPKDEVALSFTYEALDQPFSTAKDLVIEAFERAYVGRIVERHGGNVTQAAAASGLSLRYFNILRSRARSDF